MTNESIGHVENANTGRSVVQTVALVIGIVFVVLGVLGFVPGVTAPYGELSFTGHSALLFGVFQVSVLDNLVHLVLGVAGMVMARTSFLATAYLVVGAVFYLLVWLYVVLADPQKSNDSIPTGVADVVLHIAVVVVMIGLAVVFRPGRSGRTPARINEVA